MSLLDEWNNRAVRPTYEACHDNDEFVTLDQWEMMGAIQVGKWMREESLKDGRREYANKPGGEDGGRLQEIGALAERAAAKALDLYWPALINKFKVPDLSHKIDVRLIGVDHYGLRVRDSDDPDLRIVGVVIPKGKETEPYRLPGWIRAGDGCKSEWAMNPWDGRPMYAVPQSALNPLNQLRRIIWEENGVKLDPLT